MADKRQSEQERIRECSLNDMRGANLLPFDNFGPESDMRMRTQDPCLAICYSIDSTIAQREKALLELMLQRGADVNAQTHAGITPLFICAQYGQPELAEVLIQYGADPNLAPDTGCTPLMWTTRRGDVSMTKLLIEAGTNVDAQVSASNPSACLCSRFESGGWHFGTDCLAPVTALALAAERGHYDIVELLLRRNADPNVRIVHHAHGLLRAKNQERRRKQRSARQRQQVLESDSDSDPEPEVWKGYISVGIALSWARDDVRELLLRYGADPSIEEPIRECGCVIEPFGLDDKS